MSGSRSLNVRHATNASHNVVAIGATTHNGRWLGERAHVSGGAPTMPRSFPGTEQVARHMHETLENSWKSTVEHANVPPAALMQDNNKAQMVMFMVRKETQFGQMVRLVGDAEQLGHWSVNGGVELFWGEGHWWRCSVLLPPGSYQFKFVLFCDDGSVKWESCSNRAIQVSPSWLSSPQNEYRTKWDRNPTTTLALPPSSKPQPLQWQDPTATLPVALPPLHLDIFTMYGQGPPLWKVDLGGVNNLSAVASQLDVGGAAYPFGTEEPPPDAAGPPTMYVGEYVIKRKRRQAKVGNKAGAEGVEEKGMLADMGYKIEEARDRLTQLLSLGLPLGPNGRRGAGKGAAAAAATAAAAARNNSGTSSGAVQHGEEEEGVRPALRLDGHLDEQHLAEPRQATGHAVQHQNEIKLEPLHKVQQQQAELQQQYQQAELQQEQQHYHQAELLQEQSDEEKEEMPSWWGPDVQQAVQVAEKKLQQLEQQGPTIRVQASVQSRLQQYFTCLLTGSPMPDPAEQQMLVPPTGAAAAGGQRQGSLGMGPMWEDGDVMLPNVNGSSSAEEGSGLGYAAPRFVGDQEYLEHLSGRGGLGGSDVAGGDVQVGAQGVARERSWHVMMSTGSGMLGGMDALAQGS